MIKFKESTAIISDEKMVVLVNTYTGSYVRVTPTVYKLLCLQCETEETLFFDEYKKKKWNSIVETLFGLQIIENGNLTQEKNDFEEVMLNITNRCNLQCKHCFTDAQLNSDEELSKKEIYNIIDILQRKSIKALVISGGEPLCRDDLFEILEYAKMCMPQVRISLSTNLTLLTDENVKMIVKYVDNISASLDGYDKYSSEYIRGKGVFDKVINNINLLHEYGYKNVSLSMVLTDYNIQHVDQFSNLCKKLEVKCIFRYFSPIGRGEKNKNALFTGEYDIKGNDGCRKCNPGKKKVLIDYDGEVYPCYMLKRKEFSVGNIREEQFLCNGLSNDKICEKVNEKLREFYRSMRMNCMGCKNRFFCFYCHGSHLETILNAEDIQRLCDEKMEWFAANIWESCNFD